MICSEYRHTQTLTHSWIYSHTKILTHRAWICLLCDERDYGIKEARPQQFSSVWTKAALSSSTMTNTDECLAAHRGSTSSLTQRPLDISNTRTSDCDSRVVVDLLGYFFSPHFFFPLDHLRWAETQASKRNPWIATE